MLRRWVGLAALVAVPVGFFVVACGFDPPEKHSGTVVPTVDGSIPCIAEPGRVPAPNCDNSRKQCKFPPTCSIDNATCGSPDTCMPMADNKGKTQQDFRIRRLNVAAPSKLASETVQLSVVTSAIDLKAKQCAETGTGSFNWILRVDRTANTLTTGGAPISTDPWGVGYCFYNHAIGAQNIAPATVPIAFTGDTFTSNPITKLNIPIFVNGDVNNVVILPITDAVVSNVTIGEDGNCIGSYNRLAVQPNCADSPTICYKWNTAGSLGGYLTLEEADAVNVSVLGKSLCAVLTGEVGDDTKCPRTGGTITPKGDFCSTSKKAGDCQDSYWLSATFAASAVKINDGVSTPECGALPIGDAGSDSGASDASADAADAL